MWLAIFAAVAAVTLADSIRRLRHARIPPTVGPEAEVLPRDPRALAWLRGGDGNLILLTAYDLVRRGFLTVELKNGKPTSKLARTAAVPDFDHIDPLETAILLAFEEPRTLGSLQMDDKVVRRARESGREIRTGLVQSGLAVPREDNVRRGILIPVYLSLLAAAAGIAVGLTVLGNEALTLLVLSASFFGIAVTALNAPLRLTRSGQRLLESAQQNADTTRLKLLYQADGKVDYLSLRAAYGWKVSLGPGEDPAVRLFDKASFE